VPSSPSASSFCASLIMIFDDGLVEPVGLGLQVCRLFKQRDLRTMNDPPRFSRGH
jgi:hypothetical protein